MIAVHKEYAGADIYVLTIRIDTRELRKEAKTLYAALTTTMNIVGNVILTILKETWKDR